MTDKPPSQRRYQCANCGATVTAYTSVKSRFTGNRYCSDTWTCDARAAERLAAGRKGGKAA